VAPALRHRPEDRMAGELFEMTEEERTVFNHHLAMMKAAGLIVGERNGRYVRNSLILLGRAAVEAAEAIGTVVR